MKGIPIAILGGALMLGLGSARGQDDPPTDYAEQTVTFGFHNRGSNHWAGPISAACAGLTGLQNPLNDRTALAQQGPDLRVTIEETKIPWDFPSDAAYHIAVNELRNVRGPIKLTLWDKNNSRIEMNGGPVELTKAGDSYNAYDNNGVCVARVQAEAQTKATDKGNAGGHVMLTVKVKPHVDFTLSENPARDSKSVDIQVRVIPSTGTLTAVTSFTIERERTRWQNHIGTTAAEIVKVNPADLKQWKIGRIYWYGDPDVDLCYGFQAPYRITLQAQYTLNGQTYNGQATRTLKVRLPQYADALRSGGISPVNNNCEITNPPVKGPDGKWCVQILIPAEPFRKRRAILNFEDSQYFSLVQEEEVFHTKQLTGEVGREQGGAGDLLTRNSVEYFLEGANSDYDGRTRVCAANAGFATMAAMTKRDAAMKASRDASIVLWDRRRCFIELKAKQQVREGKGWAEAYTHDCTYKKSEWCTNGPENPDAPWR